MEMYGEEHSRPPASCLKVHGKLQVGLSIPKVSHNYRVSLVPKPKTRSCGYFELPLGEGSSHC